MDVGGQWLCHDPNPRGALRGYFPLMGTWCYQGDLLRLWTAQTCPSVTYTCWSLLCPLTLFYTMAFKWLEDNTGTQVFGLIILNFCLSLISSIPQRPGVQLGLVSILLKM